MAIEFTFTVSEEDIKEVGNGRTAGQMSLNALLGAGEFKKGRKDGKVFYFDSAYPGAVLDVGESSEEKTSFRARKRALEGVGCHTFVIRTFEIENRDIKKIVLLFATAQPDLLAKVEND